MLRQLDRPPASERFSIGEARRIVADLFEPNPWTYWSDFLATIAVAFASYHGGLLVGISGWPPAWKWPARAALYVATVLAFYRAALFTHELTHLRKGSFGAFRCAWNVLCGIPFLVPSFMYHTHLVHHMRRHYGTPDDGEYLPLAKRPWLIVGFLAQPLYVPLLTIVRFFLLTPLCWFSPRLRRFVQQRASSMVIDPLYVRPLPTGEELRTWRLQEAGCFLFVAGIVIILGLGWVRPQFVVQAYAVSVGVLLLNNLRTLGAHRFRNTGGEMTFVEQLLDSINYPGRTVWDELSMPVGLRFHALHHLFPSMPYHNLAEAHRRLMAELPADSPYRQTESANLWRTIRGLWSEARTAAATRTARAARLRRSRHAMPDNRATAAR